MQNNCSLSIEQTADEIISEDVTWVHLFPYFVEVVEAGIHSSGFIRIESNVLTPVRFPVKPFHRSLKSQEKIVCMNVAEDVTADVADRPLIRRTQHIIVFSHETNFDEYEIFEVIVFD